MREIVRDQLATLDAVTLNMNAGGMQMINYVLALIMFGVALGVRLDMFKKVFMAPKSIILGLISQWVLLPAVTFLLIAIFKSWLTPMIGLGMILVACCPGGNISNFMTSLAKGNVELSVSLTACTTVGCTVVTPFNFWLWGNMVFRMYARKGLEVPELNIPFMDMFLQVLILLGVPIMLGMLTTKYLPKVAEKAKKPLQIFSIVVFLGMVVMSFAQNWELFIKYIAFVLVIVLVHNAVALCTGYTLASIFKLPLADKKTLTIETGIQNSGLGLLLLFNAKIFPPEAWHGLYGGMLFITAWWGIWHIISGLSAAAIFSRQKEK